MSSESVPGRVQEWLRGETVVQPIDVAGGSGQALICGGLKSRAG
jgi:hypothetical protein